MDRLYLRHFVAVLDRSILLFFAFTLVIGTLLVAHSFHVSSAA